MMPVPTDIILVTVLPRPRDFEIARLLGWYRIPLRRAPKLLEVDCLAFYQPASFGEKGGQIAYSARVAGNELTTRRELLREEADHPRAGEEYFKIQLKGLVRLPVPIRARSWRRFSFFYTTGEYLLRAEWLEDLVVSPEDRPVVWQALRERALTGAQAYQAAVWPELSDADLLEAFLLRENQP